MLPQVINSNLSISLIPYSGIQFLDFSFNLNQNKFSASFCEKESKVQADLLRLLLLFENEETGELTDSEGDKLVNDDDEIRVNLEKMLSIFDRQWLPLPVLRIMDNSRQGGISFEQGPYNWARVRLASLDGSDNEGHTHRVTVAIDTNLLPSHESRPYVAPSPDNVGVGARFGLAYSLEDIDYFLQEKWSLSIVDTAFDRGMIASKGERRYESMKENMSSLESQAYYSGLLQFFCEIQLVPPLYFVDTVSEPKEFTPINVDLVLDLGNSRTCGILVEAEKYGTIDLNNSYSLELRDLSHVEQVYSDPFPSRIEFHKANFGNNRFTARSRGDAFLWSSPVRVGWEASHLSYYSKGSSGITGLSSPKRYLWDMQKQNYQWCFNSFGTETAVEEPAIQGSFFQSLTSEGDEWEVDGDAPCATRAQYSRSSMLMFYLSEVFSQAFCQINSFGQRYRRPHTDIPRQLKRIILTMPTAMTLPERMIFEKRARLALKIVAKAMNISQDDFPDLLLQWDEATGTQTVFLYNEIKTNYRGDSQLFFKTNSFFQKEGEVNPSLKIASLDIGGGTTDLIITNFQLQGGRSLIPKQEFREGFNLAGDDILSAIIERHVLMQIQMHLEMIGIERPEILMSILFGPSSANADIRNHELRRQFAFQISMPIALYIVGEYEHFDPVHGASSLQLKFENFFDGSNHPLQSVLDYVNDAVMDAGVKDFDLKNIEFNIDLNSVDNTVCRVIGPVLGDMCELIHYYNCDYLLISGRPSMMPGVTNSVLSKIPLPVDRVISMHQYKVGSWYPFRSTSGFLSDPKTTASVGAMVCALSMGFLEGFHLQSKDMIMVSTANYIGMMEDTGEIKNSNLYFEDINLDNALDQFRSNVHEEGILSAEFELYAPMFIGFRQLNIERWPGTPFYRVEFRDPESVQKLSLPLKVTLELLDPEDDRNNKIFDVESITDAEGNDRPKKLINFRLQTMKNENGHWLDTGVFLH
jgi:hypothetical protein